MNLLSDDPYDDRMSDTIRAAVHAQVEQKIAAGETLQASIENERQARAAADDASRVTQAARRDALRAGWSETELKKLGLADAPRARRARTTGARVAPEQQQTTGNDDA